MKYLIEGRMTRHRDTPATVVEDLFSTVGNGMSMKRNGFIQQNYRTEEAFEFGDPVPLSFIYPWSESKRHQPFRKFAGCRDVGFREAAQYFIDCIEVTPRDSDVKPPTERNPEPGPSHINVWKDNIQVVKDVLLGTPTIEDKYSQDDVEEFLKDIAKESPTSDAPLDGTVIESTNSVYKIWFFDVQWSDCPSSVEAEVIEVWKEQELGNDTSIWKATLSVEMFQRTPLIYLWLKSKGVSDGEKAIIHWWW